jgi:hypothetical protein
MKKILPAIITGALLTTGCATFMNGGTVNVPVYTVPQGATIMVNGATYKSPTIVRLPRGEGDFNLHIEKENFQSIDIMLTESTDGWLWGNLLIGGLIGIAIDYMTGSAYDLEPELISANLKGANLSKSDDGSLRFILVDINKLPKHIAQRIIKNSKVKI